MVAYLRGREGAYLLTLFQRLHQRLWKPVFELELLAMGLGDHGSLPQRQEQLHCLQVSKAWASTLARRISSSGESEQEQELLSGHLVTAYPLLNLSHV